jgi:hypothetical protein
MTARLQQARQDARRTLHAEASRPALLIIGSDDPVDVTVRIHERQMWVGDIPGIDAARFHDTQIHIRFWLDELAGVPPRNAKVSVADGEAYLLAEALDPHGDTIDVAATQLSAADAAGLPLPA